MASTRLIPEKITSPFQLMAAWFVMLIILVSVLLGAAIKITNPEWASGYLVIFSSILIILVLGCVTLMLTIFRPNLQDGKEYAQWLRDKNNYSSAPLRSTNISNNTRLSRKRAPLKPQKAGKDFLISISHITGAHSLFMALSKAGFLVEIYEENTIENPDRHESIWIGCALTPKYVIESIKIAVSQWPHLKYLHLSNDGNVPPDEIHYQVYFGGASSTAEEYGLSPWLNDELLKLDPNISIEDFHRLIRDKYS